MLVDHFLDQSARVQRDRVALVCGSRRVTYRRLNDAANRLAHSLLARGVSPGDRVVVQLDNSVEAVLALFGIWRAGAVAVPINPTVKSAKLGYILEDCEAAALVCDTRSATDVSQALLRAPRTCLVIAVGPRVEGPWVPDLDSREVVGFDDVLEDDRYSAERLCPVIIDQDLAALAYTSGSTGRPKGVMLTHANMVAAATSIDAYLQNTPDDVILDVLPLSFDYGLYQVLLAFKAGARLVLERSFVYPAIMLDILRRERVTALPVVPMIAALLVKQDLESFDLSALRYITNTGAALPTAHIATLRSRLPHVRVFSMYGLTECKRVSYLPPEEIDQRPSSVGKPMDNVEVFLIDETGRRVTQGVGELVVRGSNVMRGYWRADDETARVLRPGLFAGDRVLHTGDVFRIDEDGFMYFQHRLDDIIKSRGQKVSPREIEDVLYSAPGVTEAVVIGVPDAVLGEAVQAYVTLESAGSTTEQQLMLHCSRHLEDFMVPRSITIVSELPHNSSGKLAARMI